MRFRNTFAAILFITALPMFGTTKVQPDPTPVPRVDIPYTQYTLGNGLTLIVHEDHKAPIAAVNIWYHVGSKNEKPGKTGFAHLFEHLMFNGSENYNNDWFKALEKVGATDLNGTTNEDRTNYFQNVPLSALDQVLFLESDRMGHLVGAIDKAKLDEQRGVVQNEKRQGDNEPYSISEELVTRAVWPASHPYAHTVIGSLEDLDAASLDDVKDWFRTYYGPSNAVLIVAGDVNPADIKQRVEKYFGDIPPGPPVAHFKSWVARREGSQRQMAYDQVPQPRIFKVWNVPPSTTRDGALLEMLTDVLVSDKASRLYKRLVFDEQTASSVSAFLDSREIGSLFYIDVTGKADADVDKLEKAIDEELAKVLRDGPTAEEMNRVRTQYFARFVRGAERIGGFGGKSDILARSFVYGGSADSYKQSLDWTEKAVADDVKKAGREWLSDGEYTLTILPFPKYAPAATSVDRKTLPPVAEPPAPQFVKVNRATLSNGMNLVVAERHGVPVVNFNLVIDAGYASDQFATPGTASLAANMLDEGTTTKDALKISTELSRLGANLGTGSNVDTTFVTLNALKTQLDESLRLYADVIRNPSFAASDLDRLRKLQIAGIQREKSSPFQMALRVMPRFIYGQGHAYSNPMTGSGTEASVAKISREELVKFHQTWFKPNNATLVVVGDTTLAEIQPKLESLFGSWKRGDVPKKNLPTVAMNTKPSVYLIDKPGAAQSYILAGVVAPPKSAPEDLAISTMNTILGGAFVSRLNMNLREDKHWSYGAGSYLPNAAGQRMFIAYAPVQTDKTMESVVEMQRELRGILKDHVLTAEEVTNAKTLLAQSLPGRWETANQVSNALVDTVQFHLPADYWETYAGRVRGLSLSSANEAAVNVVRPENLVWVIIGDRARIEKGVRDLNLGDLQLIDADGNPVK
ncbi:MAG TPA: pitrilysin family protein [Thermoanaerobaculia bacterium]|nr:pitrilysin family protein [Thermoanaerobaculia bacterium]